MAYWTTLKAAIANVIKTNGNKEITGAILKNTLNSIVNAVGENATFAGVAIPTTNPGTPDGPVFYLAYTQGTYANFSGIELDAEDVVIIKWSGSAWTKINTGLLTNSYGFYKTSLPWLSSLGGLTPNTDVPYINKITAAIKDIWFAFPNGVPSWWETRTPQLRALNGGQYGSPKIRLYFRLEQQEKYGDYGVDFNTTYYGRLQLLQIPVTLGNQPTFYTYIYLDTTDIAEISESLFTSAMSQAIQPLIVKKTHCSISAPNQQPFLAVTGKLQYNSSTKKLTIPPGTNIVLDGNLYPSIITQELDLSTISTSARVNAIVFNTNTLELTVEASNATNFNPSNGGDRIIIGVFNAVLNRIYMFTDAWSVDGFDRGINYIGSISEAKTILTPTPLVYNKSTFELTVPKGARIISANGNVVNLQQNTYSFKLKGDDANYGYRNVYIKSDGTIISVLYRNNQTTYIRDCMWIGWVHTSAAVPNTYFFTGLLDGSVVEKGDTEVSSSIEALIPWLSTYKKIDNLEGRVNLVKRAIKDIWFEFPNGTIPDWFDERTPILRSISNNDHASTGNYPLRIYFKSDDDTAWKDSVYNMDAADGAYWEEDDIMLCRLSKTIDGTLVNVYTILDAKELYAENDTSISNGIVISSAQGLQLLISIKKKTTPSVYSKRENLSYCGGVKTILTPAGSYVQYDSTNNKIVIPANTRTINYRGDILNIKAGDYELESKLGFYNVFVDYVNKAIVSIFYSDLASLQNQKYWNENRYYWIGWVHTSMKIGYFNALSYMIGNQIKGDTEVLQDLSVIIPQINQNPIKKRNISDGLRLLCFGSSWFQNTWWYLKDLLREAGINAEMTCFYTGGAYFQQWIDRYENNTAVDCWVSVNGANYTTTQKNFRDTLEEGWDIIAYQQGAYQSRQWSYYENSWSKLLSYIRRSCGYDTLIAFNSTWTPALQGNLSPYENTEEGQKEWQEEAYQMCKRFLALSGLNSFVAPNGATLWAVRHHPDLKDDVTDLAGDALHPNNGLPMYAISATWFETFIAPMFGVSIETIDWIPDTSTQKAPVSGSRWTDISTSQRDIIRKIIRLSASNRFGFETLT